MNSERIPQFGSRWYQSYGVPDDYVLKHGWENYRKYARTEPEIASAIEQFAFSVLSVPYRIIPVSDDIADIKVADFVQTCLDQLGASRREGLSVYQDFQSVLFRMISGALINGTYLGDPVFINYNGNEWLDCIKDKDVSIIEPDPDEFGNILSLRWSVNGKSGVIDPREMIVFSYLNEYNNFFGTSVMQAIARDAWTINLIDILMNLKAEKETYATPIGLMDDASWNDITLRNSVYAMLQSLTSEKVAVLPKSVELSAYNPISEGGMNLLINRRMICIKNIRIRILGASMGTSDVTGGTAEQAEVAVNEVTQRRVEFMRQQIAQVVNRQIIYRICDYNFNTAASGWKYPPFTIQAQETIDKARESVIDKNLIEMGAQIPLSYIHEKYQIPQREGDEPIATLSSMSAVAIPDSLNETKKIEQFAEPDELDVMDGKAIANMSAIIGRQKELIIKDVKKNFEWYRAKPERILDLTFTKKTESDLSDAIRMHLEATRKHGNKQGKEDIKKLIARRGKATTKFAESPWGSTAWLDNILLGMYKIYGKDMTASMQMDISKILLRCFQDGLSLDDTIFRLGQYFEPTIARGDLDNDWSKAARLENMARTVGTYGYNMGRLEEGQQEDSIIGYMYDATLDNRTTEICEKLNGRTWKKGDPNILKFTPPNHFRCRSRLEYIWFDEPAGWENPPSPGLEPAKGFGGKI